MSFPDPPGYVLLQTQRLVMWLLSLIVGKLFTCDTQLRDADNNPLDYSICDMSSSHISVLLYATSPVVFTFMLRPFSNSLESITLAVCLGLACRTGTEPKINRPQLAGLGIALAFGVFVRVTMFAFATPLVVAAIARTMQQVHLSSPVK